MTIIYSLIARGFTVLCNHQIGAGNFGSVAEQMLKNIPTERDTKTTYSGNKDSQFHVVVENGIIYMCVADASFGKRQPYAFLNEIKRQFQAGGHASRAHFVGQMELQSDFGRVLAVQMEKFSTGSGPATDGITTLQTQVNEVKGIMEQNIEKVLERGDKLDDLVDKTTELEESSKTFQKTARKVSRKYWWKNTKMTLILVGVALVVVVVIVLIILFSTGAINTSPTTTTMRPPITTTKQM